VPNRRKHALDRVRRSVVIPVFGGKVVERRAARFPGQARGCLVVFRPNFSTNTSIDDSAEARFGARDRSANGFRRISLPSSFSRSKAQAIASCSKQRECKHRNQAAVLVLVRSRSDAPRVRNVRLFHFTKRCAGCSGVLPPAQKKVDRLSGCWSDYRCNGIDVILCGAYPQMKAFVTIPSLVVHDFEEVSLRKTMDATPPP
jgi:hypothetical protein